MCKFNILYGIINLITNTKNNIMMYSKGYFTILYCVVLTI